MNKTEFLAIEAVDSFTTWLAHRVENIEVRLHIKRSRFVPTPIEVICHGFEQVKEHYVWRSVGMKNGRWDETKDRLRKLAENLRTAKTEEAALQACHDILLWGGNRNWGTGAFPFLKLLASKGELLAYLAESKISLALAAANCNSLVPPVQRMNAMLTKVHALNAEDGLPIYDSRVAAASASLVELWRREQLNRQANQVLPQALMFPATLPSRTVDRLFSDAETPGILHYSNPNAGKVWTQAKVRLGWLIEQVLGKAPTLFNSKNEILLADRMRAFEAVLFLIGYNVRCLHIEGGHFNQPVLGVDVHDPLYIEAQEVDEETPAKQRMPLSGNGTLVEYWGNPSTGFDVVWGETYFTLKAEFVADLLGHFKGQRSVPLAANVDGEAPPNSLGVWIEAKKNGMSRKYASAIAAILVNENVIRTADRPAGAGPRAIYLDFSIEGSSWPSL